MGSSEDEIRAVTVGEPEKLTGRVIVVDYDPAWPEQFRREAGRIRRVLGDRVEALDSADEDAHLPHLERAGYRLRIREPGWHEHRMLKGPDAAANLHVFSAGCPEVARMLLFRDWLRVHDDDREAYAAVSWGPPAATISS